MKRNGIRPRLRLAVDWPGRGQYRRVFPFRRPWKVIAIIAVVNAIFIVPAIGVFRQAMEGWSGFEDLFDLTVAVFSSAWLLGWSIAPLIMTLALLLMLFGREVVTIHGSQFRLAVGLPFLGIGADYRLAAMRNLRAQTPLAKSGKSWRGPHLEFDYGAHDVAFGSNAGQAELAEVRSALQSAYGGPLRSGEARPDELLPAESTRGKKAAALGLAKVGESPQPATSAAPALTPVSLSSPSTLALILANLLPLAGTVFLGWNLGEVMVLYWAESAVIGIFNLAKMAVIGRWAALFTGVFFIAHFGAFMSVHFMFIYDIFVEGMQGPAELELQQVRAMFVSLWPALAALFVSHGISFLVNFLGRREYQGRTLGGQMGEPYGRIVLMHLVIIFGGGLSLVLGNPTPVLVMVILGKILLDVRAHLKAHRAVPAQVDMQEQGERD